MRTARLEYPSGLELLRDYWGFLGSGGLSLGERVTEFAAGLADGDPIVVDVRVKTLRKEYRLAGRVRRRGDGGAVIAFEAGQPEDLLNAAWADGQGVPERRHRRWNVAGVRVRYRVAERESIAELVNVSRGGCCLRLDMPVRPGGRVSLVFEHPMIDDVVDGRIRWSGGRSRIVGVEFERFHEALVLHLVGTDMYLPGISQHP